MPLETLLQLHEIIDVLNRERLDVGEEFSHTRRMCQKDVIENVGVLIWVLILLETLLDSRPESEARLIDDIQRMLRCAFPFPLREERSESLLLQFQLTYGLNARKQCLLLRFFGSCRCFGGDFADGSYDGAASDGCLLSRAGHAEQPQIHQYGA